MHQTKPPWSVPVPLSDIPDTGRRFELAADEATRAEVAKLCAVQALPHLQATFEVTPQGSRGLRVTGYVKATVGQNCVVTLDPMENEIEENIDLLFMPSEQVALQKEKTAGTTENVDPNAPEPLIGNEVDLGKIATEFLFLGIDPYPRKPGAAFEPPPLDDPGTHPFAALAALKKGQGGGED